MMPRKSIDPNSIELNRSDAVALLGNYFNQENIGPVTHIKFVVTKPEKEIEYTRYRGESHEFNFEG